MHAFTLTGSRFSTRSSRLWMTSVLCLGVGLPLPRLLAMDTTAPVESVPLESPNPIRLNSIGFPCKAEKRATLAGEAAVFRVRRVSDGVVVFSGRSAAAVQTPKTETNERVSVADFSALVAPGPYVLEAEGLGTSCAFSIGEDVWNRPFEVSARAFYLWRCGVAVDADHEGRHFHHEACHTEDGWLDHSAGEHRREDLTGGWHDAGDYNKYVVNAGVSVGFLFKAWEQNRGRVAGMRLGIPESGGTMPDLLAELRFECEWLLKMQLPDGRVLHKVSSTGFRFWGPSEKDRDPRYASGWGSTATADFTAMMALAARHFREFDAAFAARCEAAARLSYAYLRAHPAFVSPEQSALKTGGYDSPDATPRLWAAEEMYELSGDKETLADFEARAAGLEFSEAGPNWGDPRDFALGSYLLSGRPEGRREELVTRLRAQVLARADHIVETAASNAYERPLGAAPASWNWGCNGSVAGQTYLLQVAQALDPKPAYREATLKALGHLFGRNFFGRSFVSGLGHQPPQHMHDRRGEPAWPGYLVGGGWPDGRSWRDELASYKTNEIAINWNAALVYALSTQVQVLEVVWEGRVLEEGLVQRTETSPALLNYTVANKGSAPLRLDRIQVETNRSDLSFTTDLREGTVIPAGASVEPFFHLTAPAGGQGWEARISIYYNGDTQHPFVWTVRKI